MPPEPLPWDRRRHDRPGSEPRLAGGGFGRGGPNRWREQQHAPPPYYQQRQQQQRWYSDARSPRLLPPGNGKQGGRHMYSDDGGQGCLPSGSRYADRNSEDGNHRPFGTRGDGGYFRNNRENRGSFARKDWKTHTWERANSPSSFASHRPSNYVDLSEQSQSQALLTEKNNKNGGTIDETTQAGPEYGKGNCMRSVDWKPLKWTRLGSSSSRGNKLVAEVQPKHATLGRSLPDDSCVRSTSLVQYEETESRKKPRLGWGQGLAKFEKKDIEGPEDCAPNNELVHSVTCTETMLSQSVLVPEKSPRFSSLSDCASPGTPSSVVCSSSPGIEDKESLKEAHMCPDRTILSCSPTIMSHTHYNAPTFNLENFELASIANVSSLIEELLLSNDSNSAESGYVRTTSMNKLLVWKVDMLKALEMTESEIESLETELKSLKECERPVSSSKCGIEFDPLHIDSCEKMIVKNEPVRTEDVHVFSQDANINSPGSVTSKCVEVRPTIFPSETAESIDVSRILEVKNSGYSGSTTHADLAGNSNVHYNVDNIHDSIFSSNRDAASRAMDQLNKLSPKDCLFDSSIEAIPCLQRDSSLVEKFLRRKRFLRFKEKVVTLKFKVFQHFWKEGRLVSVRKLRGKKQKKFGPSRNGHRKNLSSFCSRVSSSVGGRQTVPANEVIQYVSSLLSESAFKPCRNTLKMPALILDKEVKMSRFISVNGLMEDPCAVEKERSMINSWTSQEKDIFLDKLAAFGKDFPKIASFLDHKTVANCIEFYYKNHKSECFDKTRKNPGCPKERKSQSSTYMVTPMTRRNPELNAASLDILSAVSEIAANIDNGMAIQSKSFKAPVSDDGSGSDDRETEAADVLASICVSLSSEAVGSCITSCIELPTRQALTHEVTQYVDEECSDESCAELNPTDWSDEEKSIFIRAVSVHGKDFSKISESVRTRSMDQCKLFFSKARKCLGLDLLQPGPGSSSDDGDGGDGDIEEGSTMETEPVISNNRSECQMDEDLPPPDTRHSDTVGAHNSAQLNGPENKPLVGRSDEEENQREGRLPEGTSDDKIVVERDANSCEASEISSGITDTKPDPQPSRNVFLNHKTSSAVGGNEISGMRFEKTVDCQQHLPCHSMSDSTESSQILQEQPVNLNSDWHRHTDFFPDKCNGAREQSNIAEASFPSSEPSRSGDVKLFGTILIPSKQKTTSFMERSNSNNRPLIPEPGADRTYKTEDNPIRSFGLWDGNWTQTGTPPLPDSAILLAKYPAAFSNSEQPFTIDTKQRQDVLDEMRRRQCSSLSDPVAAIRMQNAGKEDDRWISSRNVGR